MPRKDVVTGIFQLHRCYGQITGSQNTSVEIELIAAAQCVVVEVSVEDVNRLRGFESVEIPA